MKLKLNKNEVFELGWAILLLGYLFVASSEIGLMHFAKLIKYAMTIITISLWIYKIYNDKYEIYVFLFMVLGSGIIGMVAVQSSRESILLILLFLIAAKDIDIKHFITVDMRIRIVIIIALFILSITGVIANYSGQINGTLKYAFGWQHPNTCASTIILVLLEWMYLKWNKFRWYNWLITAIVITFLMKFIASRTSLISFGIVCIWFVFIRHVKQKKHPIIHKLLGIMYTMSYFIIALISFIVVAEYQNRTTLGRVLNRLMTSRLKLSSYYLSNYGISLWGQSIATTSSRQALLSGTAYSGIDMAFINLIVQYGAIYTLIFLLFYTYLCYKLYQSGHYQELLLVLFFAIVGFASSAMTIFYRNFTMIFIWLIYKERMQQKTDKTYFQSR